MKRRIPTKARLRRDRKHGIKRQKRAKRSHRKQLSVRRSTYNQMLVALALLASA